MSFFAGFGASLVGGLLSSKSAKKAAAINYVTQIRNNEANQAIARETNNYNLQQTREANATNRATTNATNRSNRISVDRVNAANVKIANQNNQTALRIHEQERRDAKNAIQITAEDARKAGINPLTAIRAGQAFQGPQAPALTSPNLQAAVAQAHRAEAHQATAYFNRAPRWDHDRSYVGEALAQAGETLFAHMANQPDPEKEYLEKQILAEELDQMQEAGKVFDRDFGFAVPRVTNYSGENHGHTGEVIDADYTVSDGDKRDPSNLRFLGFELDQDEGTSHTEAFEGRYGDWVGNLVGFGVGTVDAVKNWNNFYAPYANRMREARLGWWDQQKQAIKNAGRDGKQRPALEWYSGTATPSGSPRAPGFYE